MLALDEVADDQHGMSASTLNLGQKKGYEALQKLKKFKQIPEKQWFHKWLH